MSEIRRRAAAEHLSINRMINRLLRSGLESGPGTEPPFKETVYAMGEPSVDLTRALALAAELEDQDVIEKLKLGQ